MARQVSAGKVLTNGWRGDVRNAKAWYRRGVARVGLGQFECAVDDFRAALEIEPNNREARAELEAEIYSPKEIAEIDRPRGAMAKTRYGPTATWTALS